MKYVILNAEGIPVLSTSSLDEATILILQDGWKMYEVPNHNNEETYSDLDTELLINGESGMLIATIEVDYSNSADEFNDYQDHASLDSILINGINIDKVNITEDLKRDIESNAESMINLINE